MMQMIDMNFSGVYERRERLAEVMVNLTGLSGTNAYCSDEAVDVIREKLAQFPAEGIHFLDSGNYHYATLFWLEKIRTPYQLVVFDHHTDMQPSAWGDELLSCGSWIRTALLHDPHLQKVWIAGTQEEAYLSEMRERIRLITESELSDPEKAFSGLDRETPVYISVDKDVLSEKAVDTNWDQGNLQTEVLLDCLRYLFRQHPVIGIDVCGEPDVNASDTEIKKSEEIDRKIVQVF